MLNLIPGDITNPPSSGGGGGGSSSYVRRKNGTSRGSTNTNVVRFSTACESGGSDITYNASSTNGDSFTVNTSGVYTVSLTIYNSTGGTAKAEIRTGSAIENTVAGTEPSIRSYKNENQAEAYGLSATFYIPANDLVWVIFTGTFNTGLPDLYQVSISGPH